MGQALDHAAGLRLGAVAVRWGNVRLGEARRVVLPCFILQVYRAPKPGKLWHWAIWRHEVSIRGEQIERNEEGTRTRREAEAACEHAFICYLQRRKEESHGESETGTEQAHDPKALR